jgi:hypothetical protein
MVTSSISLKHSAEVFLGLCFRSAGFGPEISEQMFVVTRSAHYNNSLGVVFLILDKTLNRQNHKVSVHGPAYFKVARNPLGCVDLERKRIQILLYIAESAGRRLKGPLQSLRFFVRCCLKSEVGFIAVELESMKAVNTVNYIFRHFIPKAPVEVQSKGI